jgi:integrase
MALERQPIPQDKIGEVLSNLNPFDARLFRGMLLTGVRVCEARLLGVADILGDDGAYRHGFITIRETKGGHPRNVVMTPQLVALFEECREAYGGKWKDHDYRIRSSSHGETAGTLKPVDVAVFRPMTWRRFTAFRHRVLIKRGSVASVTRRAQKLPLGYQYNYVKDAFNKAFRAAGLYGPHTSHGIRKTFAEMILEAVDATGRPVNDIFTLKELLGHSCLSSTLHYVKGISVRKALNALDAAYESSGIAQLKPNFSVRSEPAPEVKPGMMPEPQPPTS